jgi:hypothetical protein
MIETVSVGQTYVSAYSKSSRRNQAGISRLSALVMAASLASSEPSVAKRIFLGR